MKKKSVLRFMLVEHGNLRELLAKFRKDSDEDLKRALNSFERFKDRHGKHVFIEEKAVFNFSSKVKKMQILKIIIKQHREILKFIRKIESLLDDEKDATPVTANLQEFLKAHIRLEEKKFYPVIDKELNDKEREKILKKITRIMKR